MKAYIFRPYSFVYSFRSYKILNESKQLINTIENELETVLKDPPKTIYFKIDLRHGSYTFNDESKEDVYLICYFTQRNFFSLCFPDSFKNFIKLKEVSKEEYEKAIETNGNSLPFFKGYDVSKTKALASRFLSGFEVLAACLLFYNTDYSGLKITEDVDFIRFLGLILFIGGVFGLIWNINKNLKILERGLVEIGLTIYIAYHINIFGGQINWFILPIVGMMSVIAFYFYRKREQKLN